MKFPYVIVRRAKWEWTTSLADGFEAWDGEIRGKCSELFLGPHPGNPDAVWRLISAYKRLLVKMEGAHDE